MSVRIVNTGRIALAVKVRGKQGVDYVQLQAGAKVDLPEGYTPDHNFMVNNPAIKIVEPLPVVNLDTEDNNDQAES